MNGEDVLKLLTSGGYGIATLLLLALVYLYRELEAARKELLEAVRADGVVQRDLLMTVVPLATKLSEGIALLAREIEQLERVTEACRRGPT